MMEKLHWMSCLHCFFWLCILLLNRACYCSISIDWKLSNWNRTRSWNIKLPNDVYVTVLKSYGSKPYWRDNDKRYRWIGTTEPGWHYDATFKFPNCTTLTSAPIYLFLDGVTASGTLSVNGKIIGKFSNSFRRYSYNITPYIKAGRTVHNLLITLRSPGQSASQSASAFKESFGYSIPPDCPPPEQHGDCHINMLRSMQAGFGWDFGPSFPTLGLGKVKITTIQTCKIVNVYHTNHHTKDNIFQINLETELLCSTDLNTEKELVFSIPNLGIQESFKLGTRRNGFQIIKHSFSVTVPSSQQWWPNGYGTQSLHEMSILLNSTSKPISRKQSKIGFRSISKIESLVDKANPQKGATFQFVVNGLPIFLKGSNWVPPTAFSNNASCADFRFYFDSMKAAHFNTIRVWGGGYYQPDCFYELADQYGILIWHDFMFACFLYPADKAYQSNIKKEIIQQVNRLKSHPSILLWAGNNEVETAIAGHWYIVNTKLKVDYWTIFNKTIGTAVAKADPTRIYLISSPSNGEQTCSNNKYCIGENPGDEHFGDVHFYDYQHNPWNSTSFPIPRCASEFGYQSLPSLSTLKTVLNSEDLAYDSAQMLRRQHHGAGLEEMLFLVEMNFPVPKLNKSSPEFLSAMIYLTQLTQAIGIRTESEHYRRWRSELDSSGRGMTMCALYWQLNDMWPAPSWASIDYGKKWKILHYHAVDFFAPLALMAERNGTHISIFVLSDVAESVEYAMLVVDYMKIEGFTPIQKDTHMIGDIQPLSSKPVVHIDIKTLPEQTFLLRLQLIQTTGAMVNGNLRKIWQTVPEYVFFVRSFKSINMTAFGNIKISHINKDPGGKIGLTLNAMDSIIPFLWLDSKCPGRFNKNGFTMTRSKETVEFDAVNAKCVESTNLQDSFTIMSLPDLYK